MFSQFPFDVGLRAEGLVSAFTADDDPALPGPPQNADAKPRAGTADGDRPVDLRMARRDPMQLFRRQLRRGASHGEKVIHGDDTMEAEPGPDGCEIDCPAAIEELDAVLLHDARKSECRACQLRPCLREVGIERSFE